MNTPGLNVNGDCAPWYVDVSCPPYSVRPSPVMTPEEQRKGIQQAWDDVSAAGGGIVVLPEMYTVGRAEGESYCLRARDNVAIWGIDQFSSGLRMAPDTRALMLVATSPLHAGVGATNVSFARLTLDGNKAGFSGGGNPQCHCLWLEAAVNVLCDQVRFLNPLMDGAYHFTGTHEVTFRDCLFTGCGRDGISFTSAAHNVKISRCRFQDITAQQIDSEPKNTADVPYNILVEDCTFEPATGPGKFVVSVAGAGRDRRTHNWRFISNRFEGGVIVTWARDIAFLGNEWVISDETYKKPCLTIYRMTEHVDIIGNTFESTVDCIDLRATSSTQQPRQITIDGNTLLLLPRTAHPASRNAVDATAGPGEYVISNNTVLGPADGTDIALNHRATRLNKSVILRGNIVRQCLVGFQLVSAGTERFERAVLEGNTFDPGLLPASFALVLDLKENVIDDFVMADNILTGVGVVPVARNQTLVPYDGSQIWHTDGNTGLPATYSCVGSPLGQFDAPIGSLAVLRDGAVGSTLYVKETGTPAGWVAR